MHIPDALPDVLIFGSMPLIAAAFVLFRRAIRDLGEDELRRFNTEGMLPGWRRMLGVVPFAVVFFVEDARIQLAAASWCVVQQSMDHLQSQRLLEQRSFAPDLRERIGRTSLVGLLATTMLTAGLVLQGVQTRGWPG